MVGRTGSDVTRVGVTKVGVTRVGNLGCHPYFFSKKTDDLFCSLLSLLLIDFSLVSSPLEGVTPHFFYLSDLVCPLFFANSPINFLSFGCHPLEGVSRGGPPLFSPPSDATAHGSFGGSLML